MDSVREILSTQNIHDLEDMDIHESYTVTMETDAMMDLDIEKVYEDILMVGHFYTQRGDQMADPEVRFNAADWDNWYPVEYRQDGFPQVYESASTGLDRAVVSFVERFDENLWDQGYVERARNGYID